MTLLHQAAQKAVEALTDEQIKAIAHQWFVTGENQLRADGYYYRSLGTVTNVRESDLIAFAREVLARAEAWPAIREAITNDVMPNIRALQHQEVPREPVDAERTMICKACGFDRFKEPCDRSPCEFVAVAPITPQQETRSELSAEDRAILEAVHREMDECDRGNAPGHAHDIPGIWDGDNGAKAGKPCAWCLTWRKFTALVDGAAAPSTPAHQNSCSNSSSTSFDGAPSTPENAGGVKEGGDAQP